MASVDDRVRLEGVLFAVAALLIGATSENSLAAAPLGELGPAAFVTQAKTQTQGAESSKPLTRAERKARKRAEAEEKKRARVEAPQPSAGNRLEAVAIVEGNRQAEVTIRTAVEPKWLARERSDGGIALQLLDTEPAAGLAPEVVEDGIVAEVDIIVIRTSEAPNTLVEISTRVPVSYSVRPLEDGLSLRLRPTIAAAAGKDTVTPTTPSQLNAARDKSEYKVGAGDLLAIEVFGLPELSRKLRVDTVGTVNFPILGAVDLMGLSLREAEARLAELLSSRGLVNDPVVAISVDELVSRRVSIQGAVSKPGLYQLLGPKTLLELLVEAGGLSGGGPAGRSIHVFRRSASGGQLRTEIDAERLLEQGDMSLNVELQPGDIVQVPQPKQLRVYVSGAVRSPGPIDYRGSDGLTLLQAITSAGGPTERARLGAVQVIRRQEDGTEERFELDLKKISKGKLADFPLERGDTVVVKDWFF